MNAGEIELESQLSKFQEKTAKLRQNYLERAKYEYALGNNVDVNVYRYCMVGQFVDGLPLHNGITSRFTPLPSIHINLSGNDANARFQ